MFPFEVKEQFDLSDHNLITATFKLGKYERKKENSDGQKRTKCYYSTNETLLKVFGESIRERIVEERAKTIGMINLIMTDEAEDKLRKMIDDLGGKLQADVEQINQSIVVINNSATDNNNDFSSKEQSFK